MHIKEYRIPVPLTLDEYRYGQQWTEIELLKETLLTCSNCVTFFDLTEQQRINLIRDKLPSNLPFNITHQTPMTHKRYHLKDQIPKYLEFVFKTSKNGLLLDEYSWNQWPRTLTIIENSEHQIRLIVQSFYAANNDHGLTTNSILLINDEQKKYLKDFEIINIAERLSEKKDYRSDEDPTQAYSKKRPDRIPLQPDTKWYEHCPNHVPCMWAYKLVEVTMIDERNGDRSFFAKATNKMLGSSIIKAQKSIYHRFHQKMVSNLDKWIDTSLQEICEQEKMLKNEYERHKSALTIFSTPSNNNSHRELSHIGQ